MIKKIISFLLIPPMFVFSPRIGAQSVRTVDADYISRNYGERNFVVNPGAEANTNNITITGTGVSVTRSTTTPLHGVADFAVNLGTAVNNRVTWSVASLDRALFEDKCMAEFKVDNVVVGTGATLHAQVYQGTTLIGQVPIIAGTDPKTYTINFPCGNLSTTTSFEVRLTTGGTSATSLNIDDIKIGKATNLAQLDIPELVGTYTVDNGTGCSWTTTSTTYVNFSDVAACNNSATGKATTTAGKIPGATFVDLTPGRYLVIANFSGGKQTGTSASNGVGFRLSNGTVNGAPQALFVSDSALALNAYYIMPVTLTMEVTLNSYTPSMTFQVQGHTKSSSNTVRINNEDSSHGTAFKMLLYRYPITANTVAFPNISSVLKAGEIFAWAGTTCPPGTLAADGASYNRADYPQLFAAIGTAHGSSSPTTFNVPDYRGRFLRGVDGTANRDPDKSTRTAMNTGGNTGNNVGSVQNHALQGHAHDLYTGTFTYQLTFNGNRVKAGAGASPSNLAAGVGTDAQTLEIGSPISSSHLGAWGTVQVSSETRPQNAYVNYCIRAVDGGNGNTIIQKASQILNDSDNSPIYNPSTGVWSLKNNSGTTRLSLDNLGNVSSIAGISMNGSINGLQNINMTGEIVGLNTIYTSQTLYTGGTQNILTMPTGHTYLFFSRLRNYGPPNSDVRHMNVAIAANDPGGGGCRLQEIYSGVGTGSGDSYFTLSSCTVQYYGGLGAPTTEIWWIRLF